MQLNGNKRNKEKKKIAKEAYYTNLPKKNSTTHPRKCIIVI